MTGNEKGRSCRPRACCVQARDADVLLVLLGGALLKISLTGLYLRYVKPAHQWLLIVAGAMMIGLATVSIIRQARGRRDAAGSEGHGHHHPARGSWLLLLPVTHNRTHRWPGPRFGRDHR